MEENNSVHTAIIVGAVIVCLILTAALGGFGPHANIGDWLIGFSPLYISLYVNK